MLFISFSHALHVLFFLFSSWLAHWFLPFRFSNIDTKFINSLLNPFPLHLSGCVDVCLCVQERASIGVCAQRPCCLCAREWALHGVWAAPACAVGPVLCKSVCWSTKCRKGQGILTAITWASVHVLIMWFCVSSGLLYGVYGVSTLFRVDL